MFCSEVFFFFFPSEIHLLTYKFNLSSTEDRAMTTEEAGAAGVDYNDEAAEEVVATVVDDNKAV